MFMERGFWVKDRKKLIRHAAHPSLQYNIYSKS
jgi:hypothetical protein